MTIEELKQLEHLLTLFRDDSFDREEYEKRESLRFDVEFQAKADGEK